MPTLRLDFFFLWANSGDTKESTPYTSVGCKYFSLANKYSPFWENHTWRCSQATFGCAQGSPFRDKTPEVVPCGARDSYLSGSLLIFTELLHLPWFHLPVSSSSCLHTSVSSSAFPLPASYSTLALCLPLAIPIVTGTWLWNGLNGSHLGLL